MPFLVRPCRGTRHCGAPLLRTAHRVVDDSCSMVHCPSVTIVAQDAATLPSSSTLRSLIDGFHAVQNVVRRGAHHLRGLLDGGRCWRPTIASKGPLSFCSRVWRLDIVGGVRGDCRPCRRCTWLDGATVRDHCQTSVSLDSLYFLFLRGFRFRIGAS